MSSHLFHLVDSSPWPLVSAFSGFFLALGLVCFMHRIMLGLLLVWWSLATIVGVMYVWWRDIIRESSYQGYHTRIVQAGLIMGFGLFIVSEMMLFVSFFWAAAHSSLSPGFVGGMAWPPKGINVMAWWHVPLLNTLLLVSSGLTVTLSHSSLKSGRIFLFQFDLLLTILLGCVFEYLQIIEYFNAPFDISDGIYGSTFYLLTGLHGLHVFVGIIFLSVMLLSSLYGNLLQKHHLGLRFAIWYWHFVDVVWIMLFLFIYVWGSW